MVTSPALALLVSLPLPGLLLGQAPDGPKADLRDHPTMIGFLARADAIFSGKMRFRWNSGYDPKSVSIRREFRFVFSGSDWFFQDPISRSACRAGRHVKLGIHPQPDGSKFHEGAIEGQKSWQELKPLPPAWAGSVCHPSTLRYVKANAGKVKFGGPTTFAGIDTEQLVWEVPADKYGDAFGSVWATRGRKPGILRLYVAPRLGYALVREQHVIKMPAEEIDFECDSHKFREVAPGIHMPQRITAQTYAGTEPTGHYEEYELLETTSVNELIPDSEFVIQLPIGTSVTDRRDRKNIISFRVGSPKTDHYKELPKDLDQIFEIAEETRGEWTWQNAVLLGAAAGAVLLFVWWFLRRRQRHGHAR